MRCLCCDTCDRALVESRAHGVTLIELVIALVVIAVAATGIVSVYVTTVASSADPALRVQAQGIAGAYLDEIMLQSYADPETGDTGAREESDRADFDDVWDYHGLDEQPTDRTGSAIDGVSDYNVTVDVVESGEASPNASPAEITVTVTHQASDRVDYVVRSQREDY